MRRLLALLLVLVVPFKSIGAAVVPIVGSPNHQHSQHAAASHHDAAPAAHAQVAPAHAGCEGMAQDVDADASTVHEHACPHLAMATLLPALPVVAPDRRTPQIDAAPARPFTSVVLDIFVPPPL